MINDTKIISKLYDEQQDARYDVDSNLSISTPELTVTSEQSNFVDKAIRNRWGKIHKIVTTIEPHDYLQTGEFPKMQVHGTEKRDQDMYMYCKYWSIGIDCISKHYSFVETINTIFDFINRNHL